MPPNPPEQLIEWMIGPQTLANPKSGDVYLSRIPKESVTPPQASARPPPKREETKLSECINASSFLPDPRSDRRFFIVMDGALHIVSTGEAKSTALAGLSPGVRIVKLGATRKVTEGLEVLAHVTVEGKSSNLVYALLVNESRIVRSSVANIQVGKIEEFFAPYTVPRCTPDAKQCLKIAGGAYLVQYSRATDSSSAKSEREIPNLVDATWTPQNDGAVYALRICASKEEAGSGVR